MANPQVEHGFTRLANEIMDQLAKTPLSDYEWRCLIFLFRKTYGWQKKSDRISLSQFAEGTRIAKHHVCRTMKKLIRRKIVTQSGNSYYVIYSFQKDYKLWLPKNVNLPNDVISIAQIGNEPLPNQVDTKYNKEIITKENQPNKLAHFSKEFMEKDIKAQALNFNICQLYGKARKEGGLKTEIPEAVLISILDEFLKRHESIKEPFPYFLKVLEMKSRDLFFKKKEIEHEELKNGPVRIFDILNGQAKTRNQ